MGCELERSYQLRIAMLCYNIAWWRGGTFYRALHLARHLVRRGHSVTLLAAAPKERWRLSIKEVDGIMLVETPDLLWGKLRSGWDLWDIWQRIRWLTRQPRFDIVHGFDCRPTVILPALFTQRVLGAGLVLDWADWFGRGGSVAERSNPLMRLMLAPVETFFEETFRPWADGTTVINSTLYRRALGLGIPPETILSLPQGSDVTGLRVLDKMSARRALGLPTDVKVIGYLGEIFHRDAELLCDAFSHLWQKDRQSRLLLIGQRRVPIVIQGEVGHAVIETGFVSYEQLNIYLAACDLFWLPLQDTVANRGRWPSKINDYLAVGRPIIGTAIGGDLADLFRKYQIGVLAQPNSEDIVRQTLVLLDDPIRLKEYGCNARQVAEQYFDWKFLVEHLERFYLQVRSNRRK